jgi:hypothetical protein
LQKTYKQTYCGAKETCINSAAGGKEDLLGWVVTFELSVDGIAAVSIKPVAQGGFCFFFVLV